MDELVRREANKREATQAQVTWANADLERARTYAARESGTRLSFARRTFPGVLAAAASAGVIVGDGWRSGTQWSSFVGLGAALLAARVSAVVPTGVLAILGIVAHTFWLVLWGLCFTAVARSLRGGKLFIGAILLTAVLWGLARVVFPLALGAGELAVMSSAHAALYLVTIAVAFTIGTRLARYA
jgi:hypothetical protein